MMLPRELIHDSDSSSAHHFTKPYLLRAHNYIGKCCRVLIEPGSLSSRLFGQVTDCR